MSRSNVYLSKWCRNWPNLELPDLCVERQIHTRYSAEVPSFLLPHFSACAQNDGSINKKQSKDLCGGESPLPLKCLNTRQRILFRVSLYKFICKETWYRAPSISTVAKYQKTVKNLYVSDFYSLRKKKYLTRTGCKDLRAYEQNTQRMLA